AATPPRGTLYIPGIIRLNSKIELTRPVRLIGDGPGHSGFVQGYDGTMFSAKGTQGEAVALTGSAAAGDVKLKLVTTGIVAGNYLRLYSTEAWAGAVNGATHGEVVRVL